MKPSTRRKLRFAAGFAAFFVAIWLLWPTPIVYPLKIFVVLFHELSHALAAIATGGQVERILLNPAQGGVTEVRGGNPFIMLSAGYLGSLAWGLLLLELAHTRARTLRIAVGAVGVFILAMTVLYVRGIFGAAFSLLAGATLLIAARRLGPAALVAVLNVLGLTSALYALLDIRSDILQRSHLPSDAQMLAQLTGVPTVVWGVLWGGIGLVAGVWMVRRQYARA
ncbi:MAG: M50 family metallopeptidase [Longimicrobiales bacterium]